MGRGDKKSRKGKIFRGSYGVSRPRKTDVAVIVPAKKKAAPKKEKMYTAINTKTGKADFDKPKVTAAQRLKQEDRYKAYKRITTAAKESMKKKKRG